MKILITGSCGFVGSSLAAWLRERDAGLTILGIDNFIRPGSEANRQRLRALGVTVRHGDIRLAGDFESLPVADWVIDAAANPSVLAGVDGATSSRQLLEHNLTGTINTLEYCRRCRAGLILLSTSRVYSIPALGQLPLRVTGNAFALDDAQPLPTGVSPAGLQPSFSTEPPLSFYGVSKRASELLALEHAAATDLPVWINRCGVLAGAGQFGTAEQGIFSYWLRAHAAGRNLRFIGFGGAGHQVRDAFHPDDLAELIFAQIHRGRADVTGLYSVGGGAANALSLAQLAAWCDQRFGPRPVASEPTPRTFDVPWIVMDAAAARADFGWEPHRPLGSILDEIAAHAEQHPDWLQRAEA